MERDIRHTVSYLEAEALWTTLRRPGHGEISDVAELNAAPNAEHVVFTGTVVDRLTGALPTRICRLILSSGATQPLTSGPNTDRSPKYSPDGSQIAFLSDRAGTGNFQLYVLDAVTGVTRQTSGVEGWVEYLHWSPDGLRILLGVAGHGADLAGTQGAVTSHAVARESPAWIPAVETGSESFRWRSVWIYELATDRAHPVSATETNVWEATWCGKGRIAVIASPGPEEGDWYAARLHVIDADSGKSSELYRPEEQLSWLAGSPNGKHLAVAEGVCSDRYLLAGDLRLIEVSSGACRRVQTSGVNITTIEWRSERMLLLAGLRGFETVVGLYDVASGEFKETWHSTEISTAGGSVCISGLWRTGDCVLAGETFARAPEIAVLRDGAYQTVRSFDLGYAEAGRSLSGIDRVQWVARDGLEIQGWLLRPNGPGPYPLVMNLHGGPISSWRPAWLGRQRSVPMLMLLRRGIAIFLPNPRGSFGRGQAFARQVLNDVGGMDARDCLGGIDHLVSEKLVDGRRLAVMGVSYGGFLSATLITSDSRFSAAVLVAPITNYVTEELTSNIPHFVRSFAATH